MVLALMRFAGFEWEHNPLKIQLQNKRVECSQVLPFYGTQVADLCDDVRVISGSGELVGEDCLEQYDELLKLYRDGRKGVLTIPGLQPVYAYFSRLCAVAQTIPDVLCYEFEFTEIDSLEDGEEAKVYISRSGETLFDIAAETGVSVGVLVKLNPDIRRPDEVKSGREVKLC